MLRRSPFALVASVSLASALMALSFSVWTGRNLTRSADRNGDGRPDVWRSYDRLGRILEMTLDTNFDGRSDVYEYYERGALVRRESDRDFNDRIDLVQQYEGPTSEHASSIVDVDADGTADLLVLFQGGRPVFTKWSHPKTSVRALATSLGAVSTPSARDDARPGQLVPLENPFAGDLAVRAVSIPADSGDAVGLSTAGGLPAAWSLYASPLARSTGLCSRIGAAFTSFVLLPYSPRGPPSLQLPA
jgi:hypothetical protein